MVKKYKPIIWIALCAALLTALYFGVLAKEPIEVSLDTAIISESADEETVVGTLTISCYGDPTSVALKSGAETFALESTTKPNEYELKTIAELDYETADSYTLTVSAVDGNGDPGEDSVTVTVLNVDEKAPIAASSTLTTDEDTAKDGKVKATDDEELSNPLTYEVVSNVAHGLLTFSKTDGSYTYTPTTDFSGSDSFTYRAFDGTNYSDEATVTITVTVVNDAPKNDSIPTVTGTFHAGNTLTAAAGTWTDADSDISAATYAYQWQTAETGGGTATDITDAKSSTYSLVTKDGGKYIRAKVTCTDDGGAKADAYSDWKLVENFAPVIDKTATSSMTFVEDGAAQNLTFTASDDDAGDTLTWSIKTNPSKGDLTLVGSTATYTPAANAYGADSFEISVTDGCATDSIIVNVTITSENDLPVNGTKPTFSGTMKTGGVLTAANGSWTDTEDAPANLTYTYQWQSADTDGGTATDITDEKSGTYTVKSADKGKYIRVKVSCKDIENGVTSAYSDWQLVGNTSPVIKKDDPSSMSFLEDGVAQSLTFTATDTDTDDLIWTIKTDGAKGHATISGSTATYTPTANENGNDSFVVSVSDGTDTDTITVSVTIKEVNDEPSFTDIANQTVLEDCGAQSVSNCTTGSKGPANENTQTLIYTVTNDNNGLFSAQPAISSAGTLTYTPKTNANGSATVTVTLKDSGGTLDSGDDTSVTKTFTITVTAVNDTPTFTKGGDQSFAEDCGAKTVNNWATSIYIGPEDETAAQTYLFLVSTNNDVLFKILPAIDTSGNLTYTPADNANGSATVTVYLKDSGDGANTSAAATFTITITAENDTPTITGSAAVSTDEDIPYVYHFTAEDIEDAAGSLNISWDTGDTSLLAKAKMVLGGSGTDRTLTLTPVADRSGSVNFTITVRDSGGLSVTKTVAFTVNAVNDAPLISAIADRTINEDTSSGTIGFAISDVDSALNTCEVTVTSSDQSVVENKDIVLGGSGANRTITLTPVENSSGETTITVKVNDKSGAANAETTVLFKVTVNSVDDAPTIDDIKDLAIVEDHDTGDILFNVGDVDDTVLTVSASADNTAMIPKANLTVTKVSGNQYKLKAIPVANKFGTATITVTVKDPSGLMATDSFILTVNSENDLPTLSAVADQSTSEDTPKAVSLTISDIETAVGSLTVIPVSSSNTDLITIDRITIPGTGATRTMTLNPIANAHGESTITIRVTDGDGGSAERTFKLTVSSVNDAPTFTKGADISEAEDCGAKSYADWAAGISAGPDDEIADGQTVSFTVTNDNHALFSVQPGISSDGTLSFTSSADANGYATVTVTAKDSVIPAASSAAVTFKITLTAVNDAPVAHDMTKTLDTDENQNYRGYLVGTDVDKDALKFSITKQPTNGTVTITNADTGAFQYTPKEYYFGDDTFKFKVNDGTVDSAEATVTMKIIGVNDPPVAKGFSLSVNEDESVTFDLSDPAHSTDIDSAVLTYTVGTPDHGTITPLGNGKYTYAPTGEYSGSDSFTFTASDGKLTSNTAMVFVTVNQVNDAPTATSETITLTENQTLNGVFKASDLEFNALTYSIVTGPDASAGTLTLLDAGKGTYTFVPALNFRGTATFTFTAKETSTSEKHETGAGTVTINMKPVNSAPEVEGTPPIEFTTPEDTPKSGNVSASDPDGDSLTYSLVSRPKHGSLADDKIDSLNGGFVYNPATNFYGTDFFTAQAVDPSGLYTSIVLVKITVTSVNDPCTAYDQWIETSYNTAVSGLLAGYDPDGDTLTYSLIGTPVGGTAALNSDSTGEFTFTPTTDWSGNASFQYRVTDSNGGTADATVHIYVHGTGGGGGTSTGISDIPDQTTQEETPITVEITTTGLTSPTMTAVSSNTALLESIVVTPKGGGAFDITMTPKTDMTGRTVITVTVTDGGNTYIKTFVLTVTPVNDDPTKNDKTISIDENKYVYDFVIANDVDDSTLTYTHTEPLHGTLTLNSDGSFKYEPTTNYYGPDSFSFTAKDNAGKTATGTVNITVRQVFRVPLASSTAFEIDEDTTYTADTPDKKLSATDYNGETLKYEIISNGTLGTVTLTDANTGKFTYVPKENLNGSDSFTFKVIGNTSGLESGIARVSVTINPVNDAPTAVIKQVDTNEDQPVNGQIQAKDIENGTIFFNLTSLNAITHVDNEYTTSTDFGTIKLNKATGAYTYTPNANANGTDHFTFKVSDGLAESGEYTVNVIVASINDAPVARDDTIHVDEDSSKSGSLSDFYTDVDTSDTHTFKLSQDPAKGVVVFNADGTYTYTPTADVNGIDYFSFKVTDNGDLSSNVAQITVIIDPINDAPKMTAATTWNINEDSTSNKFLFTVSDIEDAANALSVTGAATEDNKISGVSFSNTNGNCVMTVTPVAHFKGTATIRITVTDTGKDGTLNPLDPKSVSQDVTVTVAEFNDIPIISGASANAVTTDEDQTSPAVTFTISDEETPVSGLSVTGSSNNSGLIKCVNITKGDDGICSATVTPQDDKFGTATVTITVKDAENATRSITIAVTVNPVNDSPVVTPPAAQTINEDTGTEVLYYTISDIDTGVESIEMTASASDNSKISSITLGGNGADRTVKVVPAKDATGDVTITLTANDKASVNNIGTGTFIVHITPVNDAPTIDTISDQVTDEDISKNNVLFTIGDIDSDLSKMTFKGVSGNTALIKSDDITFTTVDGKRYVSMKPVSNANGSALITVTVTDEGNKSSSTSFKLTVNPVNDAPVISEIDDVTILEGAATGIITFNISDIDNDVVTELTVTKTSADESVIPLSGIVMTGSGGERTLKVTPLSDQNGTIKLTLTVRDKDGLTDSTEFNVNITPVNDAPSFTSGGNPAAVKEDCGAVSVPWATAISEGPANESGQNLDFVVTSVTNSTLFSTQPAISADGTLTFTPAANANGSSDVTVYLHDDGGTANGGVNKTSSVTFTITVNPVNDAPSFAKGGDVTVNEDSSTYNANWASVANILKGPSDEASQALNFIVSNDNNTLFSTQPVIDATTGKLTFKPASNANGTATVTVKLHDDGGVANSGVDTSASITFTITVSPVNDIPVFTAGAAQTVLEDAAPQSADWATGIRTAATGITNESDQHILGFTVTYSSGTSGMFSAGPSIDVNGKLTYTPKANANGSATYNVIVKDNGGGTDTSAVKTLTINVTAVNDAPSFIKGADQSANEDSAKQTVTNWATNLVKGPTADENSQTLDFIVSNDNNALFSVQPAISAGGELTYTPALNATGFATVTVKLHDNGGTANSGVDTSAEQTFKITLNPINDAPEFTMAAETTVLEDCVAQSIANWASDRKTGPANESAQSLTGFTVSNDNNGLFSAQPAISADGTLTFTPAANANGDATVTVTLKDDGGTASGGVDSTTKTFVIHVTPVNDKPSFTAPATITVNEDSSAYSAAWTTSIDKGVANESAQTVSGFTVTYKSGTADMFSAGPAIYTSGKLSFTPAADAYGSAVYTVTMKDSGGTANSGVDTSDGFELTITIDPVNDKPSFISKGDQTVNEDSGSQTVSGWVTSMSQGPSNESGQKYLSFTVTNSDNSVFTSDGQPAVDVATGDLTYTLAKDANTTTGVTVTVRIKDDGGTASGGVDTSDAQTFKIIVTPVNDKPGFTAPASINVSEDSSAYSAAWTTAIDKGAANESAQTVSGFTVTYKSGTAGMFSAGPSIDTSGKLNFTPAADAYGSAVYTVTMKDSGGTANGGADTSDEFELTITIDPVNDAPTFAAPTTVTVNEDSAAYGEAWTTAMNQGAANESDQAYTEFTVTYKSGDTGLFSAEPSVDTSGKLSFTTASNANGSAVYTVTLTDNGGTDRGGVNTSISHDLTINVTAVNDAPSFEKGSDQSVDEDSGKHTVTDWATDLVKGPTADEDSQTLDFIVSNDNNALFSVQPTISSGGELTYTAAENANGFANVTVKLHDNGGTANSGADTSTSSQTFKITVNPVNDAPVFTMATETTVLEDCVPQSVNWVSGIKTGPDNENTQTLSTFTVTNNKNDLFDAQPSIDADGKLTFTPAANANGDAIVTVTLKDDGGTASGGLDSTTKTFTIHVTPVNDAPSFKLPDKDPTKDAHINVGVSTGAKSYTGWATEMSRGPADENGQTLAFTLTTDNDGIFKTLPTIDAATGNLSFTPSETTSGIATVTVTLKDNGGTTDGGVDSASATFKIRVLAVSELKLTGTIYDAVDGTKISGATVNLLNMDGTSKATFTTGADGKYEFDGLAVSHYIIEVQKTGYNDNSRITNVAFDAGVAGVITEDFKMSNFKLVLTADPQKILGDGVSTTTLTAIVTESDGITPKSGVELTFSAATTSAPFTKTVTTGADGKATTSFTSEKLSGVDQLLIPIMVTVNDPDRKLYGSDWIYEYFVPGFVEGIVRDGNTNEPIEGATVTVYKDFDGDGKIDFTETQITGKDGKYKIAVPKGKVDYDIKITKPVKIGDKTEDVTFDQNVSVGDITGSGTPSETYAPIISASGVAVLANEDGSSSIVTNYAATGMSLQVVDSAGKDKPFSIDPATGVFKSSGLTTGATYTINAVCTLKDESGHDRQIIVGSSTITISATGEMNISQVLIDPYGTITDTNTKKVIKDADVKLYYADTANNKLPGKGIVPNTLVWLPGITGFPPHDNENPQKSDASGLYAFMVFPNTDYYIVATKSGYSDYKSPTISVGAAIVNWDFEMTPLVTDNSSTENDLAIEISSDKMKVEEGTDATLTVLYKNKSSAKVSDYTVTVTVPDGMTVADAAGGAIVGNKIVWSGVDFPVGEVKSLKIVLTAPMLSLKEQYITVKADISSTKKLINTADDSSTINLMLFSNRFEGSHKRYIRGYPDGTFGPSRNLTRAETAAIFARLLDLDVSNTATSYTDIDSTSWAAGYISAVSNYGLMKGYVDGTFLPDKAITRAEFATIAARYFSIERGNSVTAINEHFSDTADSWARSTIDEVCRYGIINGYEDGTFRPNNSISRAEAVTMVNRMLYRGPVSSDKNLFNDISASDWFFGQVMEASASHSYTINSDATETVTGWIDDDMK